MSALQRWFPYSRGGVERRIFAFPQAGAGSTVFGELREAMRSVGIDLCPGVLPGRERRMREEPVRSMADLVSAFEAALAEDEASSRALLDVPYGLLGNCSGALVAFELARVLERSGHPPPELLVACSAPPPQIIVDNGMGRMSDEELLAATVAMDGVPPDLLGDEDFRDILLVALRADWQLVNAYAYDGSQVMLDVVGVHGLQDTEPGTDEMPLWSDLTEGGYVLHELDAGHWVIRGDRGVDVASLVADTWDRLSTL